VPAKFKDCYLVFMLNEFTGGSVIIFTDTVRATARIAFLLRALGFPAVPLHGQMTQPKRLGALNKFKSGARKILVATDVASRFVAFPLFFLEVFLFFSEMANCVRIDGCWQRSRYSQRGLRYQLRYSDAFERLHSSGWANSACWSYRHFSYDRNAIRR
jgi:superfamily II DNA/RNA helicase